VAVADFDADTDQDVAVTIELTDTVATLLGSQGGHVRPKSASPMQISLVPAFAQCTAPNRIHGPPSLGGGPNDASCAPPVQSSSFLTIGAPDANGAPLNSQASIRLNAIAGIAGPPDDSDIRFNISVTDVRCGTGVATCGAANAQSGADYTGELTPSATVRLTDTNNAVAAGGGTHRATLQDFVLSGSVQVPCTSTGSTSIGSSCAVSTTLDAVSPGAVLDGRRAVWQLGQVALLDGGADGEASTTPNSRFLVQGVFIP
jgi:hypothetical protein